VTQNAKAPAGGRKEVGAISGGRSADARSVSDKKHSAQVGKSVDGRATPAAAKRTTSTPNAAKSAAKVAASKPHGRDQVVESIIDATLSLWSVKGPAELSLRSIAARAGVNYGLVHRHFRTKEAVIKAAMDRVVERSVQFVGDSTDLVEAMDRVLPPSTGAHSRLLAWAILQYFVDDVLPSEDAFLSRLRELAAVDVDSAAPDADVLAKVKAGSMLATLYGWKLFEPYLIRGLGLQDLSSNELNALVRQTLLKVIKG
jgi:AcrR family transcriptional regulator